MKKFLLIALGLIVVLIGAAIAIPFVVPTETYKQQLEAQIERATGRALTIAGPLEFSILPQLALAAEDVRFANPPGAAEADMASLQELQVQLKLWPLLRGAVEVDRFVLVKPVIHLEVDQQGRPNWELGGEPAAEQTPEPTGGEGGGPGVPVTELKLGDIRIVDGTATYTDAASGRTERIEGINLSVSLPDLQSRLAAEGSLAYKGRTIALDLAVEQPLQLVQGGSSPVALATDSELLDLDFEGTVAAGAALTAEGALELAVASIRELAAWLAEPIAFAGEGLRELRIAGQLQASPEQVAFTGATLALDGIEAAGELSANLSGALPKVSGRLDVGALDLNPYLPAGSPEPVPDPGAEGGTGAGPGGGERAGADGWSDEPIAVPPIGGAEVDFELTVASLVYQKLELGRTVLGLTLRDNQLTAELREFAAYGGRGTGSLQIALEDGTPVIRERFSLEGLQALPFLRAAADFDRLEGTVRAEIETETRGATERQLVQNLNGTGNVMFTDGAIVGINLAAMMRNAANAFLNPEAGETRKTDFAEMGGSFTVAEGVLRNDDMRLQAPALRVEGGGRVNLPKRTINYRLEPKLATTLQGQGGEREVAGLLVPVIIKGPWSDPSIAPDLSAVARRALEDPEALKEQIEQLGDQGEALKDALEGVDKKAGRDALIEGLGQALGGKPAERDASGAGDGSAAKDRAKPEEPVQKLLKGVLGN
jgi:AsmA protein